MPNQIVDYYRQQNPNDTRSDSDIILDYGSQYSRDQLAAYPDFLKDYDEAQRQERVANAPGLIEEGARGVYRGLKGLQSTGAGAMALLSGAVGAEGAKEFYLDAAKNAEEAAAQYPATIQNFRDIRSTGQSVRYLFGLAGEYAPLVAEAFATGGAGAVAGIAQAGARSGIASFLEKKAAANLLKSLGREATKAEIKGEIGTLAATYGGALVTAANSYGLSSGELYNDLAKNPNVSKDDAINISLGFGALAAIPDTILPSMVISRVFRGATKDASNKYVLRLLHEVSRDVPIEAGTEAFQELVNIAGERYADKTKRNTPLSKEEIDRIINSAAAGAVGGGLASTGAAIPKPRTTIAPEMDRYTGRITQNEQLALENLARRSLYADGLSLVEQSTISNFSPERRNAYSLILEQVQQEDARLQQEALGRAPGRNLSTEQVDELAQVQFQQEPVGLEGAIPERVSVAPEQAQEELTPQVAPQQPAVVQAPPQAAGTPTLERSMDVSIPSEGLRQAGLRALRGEEVDDAVNVVRQRLLAQRQSQPQAVTPVAPAEPIQPVSPAPEPVIEQAQPETRVAEPAPVAPVVEQPSDESTLLNQINFQSSVLVPEEGKGKRGAKKGVKSGKVPVTEATAVTAEEAKNLYPAYHEKLVGTEFSPELGEQLTSEASPESGGAKTSTKRLTAFENSQTGEVAVLGTYKHSKGGNTTYYVSTTTGRGQNLQTFLDEKVAGEQLWVPFASIRVTQPVNKFAERFADAKAFNQQVADPAKQQIRSDQRTAEESRAAMADVRTTQTGDEIELAPATGTEKEAARTIDQKLTEASKYTEEEVVEAEASYDNPEPVESNLNVEQVRTLYEIVAEAGDDLSTALLANADELRSILDDYSGVTVDLYRALTGADDSSFESFYETFDPIGSSVYQQQTRGGTAGAAAIRQGGATGPARKPGSSGQTGNQVFNPQAARLRQPSAQTEQVLAGHRFQSLLGVLAQAGINTQLFQQRFDALAGEFFQREGGAFVRSADVIALVMSDLANPSQENFITLLHEAAEYLFANESAENQKLISQAIDAFSDVQLGIEESSDPRIRQSDPAGLGAANLARERFAEYLAQKNKNLNPAAARGIVDRIFDFVRRIYVRSAMALQQLIFGRDHVNPKLVLEYANQRFAGLVRPGRGLIDYLGGRIPITPDRVSAFRAVNGEGWEPMVFDWASGQIRYPEVVPDTASAMITNAQLQNEAVFRGPTTRAQPERLAGPDTGLTTRQDVVANNELRDALEFVYNAYNQSGQNVGNLRLDAWLDMINQVDPDQRVQKIADDLNKLQLPVPSNLAERVTTLPTKAFQDNAVKKALAMLNGVATRMSKENDKQTEVAEEIQGKLNNQLAAQLQLQNNYQNADLLLSQTMEDLRDILREFRKDFRHGMDLSATLGELTQQIAQIEGFKNQPLAPQYEALVENLAKKINENKRDFIDLLLKVSQLNINWQTDPIADIRAQIKIAAAGDPLLSRIAQATPDSKALLAVVSTFAKRNDKLMSFMALRQANDAQAAIAIHQMLEVALKDNTDDLREARKLLAKVPRQGKIAGRLLAAYVKAKRQNKAMIKRLYAAEEYTRMYNTVSDHVRKEQGRLEGMLGASYAPVELQHQDELFLPQSSTATPADVLASKVAYKLTNDDAPLPAETREWIDKMQAWVDRNPANSALRQQLLDQIKQLKMAIARRGSPAIARSVASAVMGSISDQMGNSNTEAGKSAKRRILQYVSRIAQFKDEVVNGFKWASIRGAAKKALGIKNNDVFMELFYNRAFNFINSQRSLEGNTNGEQKELNLWRRRLETSPDTAPLMQRPGAWAALEKLYLQTKRNNDRHNEIRKELGIKIKDDVLGLYREQIGSTLFNIPRTLSSNMKVLYRDMLALGWQGTKFPTAEQMADGFKRDPALFRNSIAGFFTDDVVRKFARPMAEKGEPLFSAPALADGTLPYADPANISAAFRSAGGDMVKFALNLYQLEGGNPNDADAVSAHVAETMDTFQKYFASLHRLFREQEESTLSGVSLVPHQLMDARVADDYPGEWLEYQTYDQSNTRIINNQLALHAAFGRDLKAIYSDFDTAKRELVKLTQRLNELRSSIALANPDKSPRQLREILSQKAAKIGGAGYLSRLEAAEANIGNISRAKDQFQAWLTSQSGGLVEMKAVMELIHTLAGLVVQGPRSAIIQASSLFDPFIKFGPSRIGLKVAKQNWKSFLGEAYGSFMQTFGTSVQANSENVIRRNQAGRIDTDQHVSARERVNAILDTEVPGSKFNSGLIKGLRIGRELLMNTGIGKARPATVSGPEFSSIRPLSPFSQVNMWMHAAGIDGVWAAFDDVMQRAVDYVQDPANAIDVHSKNFALTPEKLGFKKGILIDDARAFNQLHQALEEYGVDLESHAKEVARNPNGPLFTQEQYNRLASFAQNELTLESNLANRPIELFSNPVLRFMSPLLGWSVSRMEQMRKAFREPGGELAWRQGLGAGLKMLSVIVPIGLAYSLLLDEYDEKVTGKKSNIRGFDEGNAWQAAVEKTARMGTFGLLGDVLNTGINMADGGDMRGLSLDSRILFMNSTLNMLNAMTTYMRQGEATYATVGRPVIQALGGSGYLQYAQILNNILSLDNAESRVTARTNATNYLRAAGRSLNMDVRTGRGSASALPNAIKPWVTEMALAAYGNDAGEFQEAYMRAVAAAKEEGKDDPVDYVKRSYASQHPLKSVFRTAPSQSEYAQLLSVLGSDGQADVDQAINSFNSYGASIGIKPYIGTTGARKSGGESTGGARRPASGLRGLQGLDGFRQRAMIGL